MTEETTETPATPPTVSITEADWTRLQQTIKRLETLTLTEKTEQKALTEAGEKYLSAMKKAALEQSEAAKEAIRKLTETSERLVGNASEKASRAIERRTIRDEFLWGLRLALMALPTLLILALSVYMGWLRLLP